MELIVTDRASIEAGIVVRGRYIVISIHDPDKPRPKIPNRLGLVDILYLAFHDAEPTTQFEIPGHIQLMTLDQAPRIWHFVQKYQDQVDTIVSHCEQGMSRSPAVVAALAEFLGKDGSRFSRDFQPNSYVYNLIREYRRFER